MWKAAPLVFTLMLWGCDKPVDVETTDTSEETTTATDTAAPMDTATVPMDTATTTEPTDTDTEPTDTGATDTAPPTDTDTAAKLDLDGDGYVDSDSGGDDCDDNNPDIHPDAEELCDLLDNNCDGVVDDDASDQLAWYPDLDIDTWGDSAADPVMSCFEPYGYVTDNTDCDDTDRRLNQDDRDFDGWTSCDGDCDDLYSGSYPGAVESCDYNDNDCDALVDEETTDGLTGYRDADGDGYGDPSDVLRSCEPTDGYVEVDGDCDDSNDRVFPGAIEACDSADNDCDGTIDESTIGWFEDDDGDGYGDPEVEVECATGTALTTDALAVADDSDCDPDNPASYPGAPELCNGIQNDCADLSWTGDQNTVAFEAADGTVSDHTADWAAGTSSLLASLSYEDPGTLHVCPGTWYVSLTLEADISVLGLDRDTTILSGPTTSEYLSLINIDTPALDISLQGFTARDAEGSISASGSGYSVGGAVRCEAASTISGSDLRFTNNRAEDGGALYFNDCDLTLEDVEFDDNYATWGGTGLFLGNNEASLTDVRFTDNDAREIGAGILIYNSDVTITESDFDGNTADGGGCAIYQTLGTLDISSTTFTNNAGDYYVHDPSIGGAISVDDSTLSVSDSTFMDNFASYGGGAIFCDSSDCTVTSSTFENNEATGVLDHSYPWYKHASIRHGYGGAISAENSTLLLEDSTLSDNEAGYGAGLFMLDSNVTVNNTDITGGNSGFRVRSFGGGVFITGGDLVMDEVVISENTAKDDGGGMYIESDAIVSLSNCEITDNTSYDLTYPGGGAYLHGTGTTLSIDTCLFSGNSPSDLIFFPSSDYYWEDTISATCDYSTGCVLY